MIIEIFTKYVLPAACGAAGGIFSPWAKIWIEERKLKYKERRKRVDTWRLEILAPQNFYDKNNPLSSQSSALIVMKLPSYSSLRAHLDHRLIDKIENSHYSKDNTGFPVQIVEIEIGLVRNSLYSDLEKSIDKIEKNWKLI